MTRFEFGVSGGAGRTAWDAAGGGAADVMAALLRSLGYGNVFTAPPSALRCASATALSVRSKRTWRTSTTSPNDPSPTAGHTIMSSGRSRLGIGLR